MKLLKPGQTVVLNEGKVGEPSTRVEAKIVGVNIYGDLSVQYKCAWWIERTYNELWFGPNELQELSDAEYMTVQFEGVKA